MGTNPEYFDCIERMMKRDRNHPSVIIWSLGNEEWAIESNVKGIRIGTTMQNFAQQFDSSRAFTAASSGGWDEGTGTITQVMGYNYIMLGNINGHHKKFPWQPALGTEEGNTGSTRGIYVTDSSLAHMCPTNRGPEEVGTEFGWKFYSARPFLAGLFYWTGFDYRGEMTPFDWPAISSQYGLLDVCGFPKDPYYYLKSWWGKEPVLHIYPNWNWKNHEGQQTIVTVYSNCDQVELFLNHKSLGKKDMPVNGHLNWMVNYQQGAFKAVGYKENKIVLEKSTDLFGKAAAIQLLPDRNAIKADGQDVSVITVQVEDSKKALVPDGSSTIAFTLEGPGKIIGVGNGDPSCHEADRYIETVSTVKIENLKELAVNSLDNRLEVASGFDDTKWKPILKRQRGDDWQAYTDTLLVIRGTYELPGFTNETELTLLTKSIVENQSVYVNGHLLASNIKRDAPDQSYLLDHKIIKPGENDYAVTGKRFRNRNQWDEPNTDAGLVQLVVPTPQWKRSLFNGKAEVIVQSAKQPGNLILKASGNGLKETVLKIQTQPGSLRPSVL
jgi:beta-galactosidase